MQAYQVNRKLTLSQCTSLALADAFIDEFSAILQRVQAGEPNYRVLSPLWTTTPVDDHEPDELFDPIRR